MYINGCRSMQKMVCFPNLQKLKSFSFMSKLMNLLTCSPGFVNPILDVAIFMILPPFSILSHFHLCLHIGKMLCGFSLPLHLLPFWGCHSVSIFVHLLFSLLTKWSSHFHLTSLIFYMASFTLFYLVCFLISDFIPVCFVEVSVYTMVVLPELKTVCTWPLQIACASRKQCLIVSVYVPFWSMKQLTLSVTPL